MVRISRNILIFDRTSLKVNPTLCVADFECFNYEQPEQTFVC